MSEYWQALFKYLSEINCRAYLKSWQKSQFEKKSCEDDDVIKERLRVLTNSDARMSKPRLHETNEDVVMIKNLTKFYNWKKVKQHKA